MRIAHVIGSFYMRSLLQDTAYCQAASTTTCVQHASYTIRCHKESFINDSSTNNCLSLRVTKTQIVGSLKPGTLLSTRPHGGGSSRCSRGVSCPPTWSWENPEDFQQKNSCSSAPEPGRASGSVLPAFLTSPCQ